MGHIGKEGGLRIVGMLCLQQSILKSLRLFHLLFHLARDLLGHNHDHDISRIIIPCHDKGLAYTYFFSVQAFAPVFYIDLRVAFFKAFL